MVLYFVLYSVILKITLATDGSIIRNLIGEPDYHKIKLRWDANGDKIPSYGFQVRYCELQTWGIQRCKIQTVSEAEPQDTNYVTEDGAKSFATDINGLRMATTYSLEVRTQNDYGNREDRADDDNTNQNIIVIPTKGFSARATLCLPQTSIIEVSTGPNFGGRIAVEAGDGERCIIDGEPNSLKDIYTLKINHTECGSYVNETTVTTFVIVQENLPILTHSTRRFLVLCTFQPDTLTVRAGISLPTANGRAHSDALAFEDGDSYNRRSRHLRTTGSFQGPEALVTNEAEQRTELKPTEKTIPIALLALFMTVGIVGLLATIVRYSSKKLASEMDNISIASSESTTSSCGTSIESGSVDNNLSCKHI